MFKLILCLCGGLFRLTVMLEEVCASWALCSSRQEEGGVTAGWRVPDGAVAPRHTLHQETETRNTTDSVKVIHLKIMQISIQSIHLGLRQMSKV